MFPLKLAMGSHAGIDGNCDWVRAQGRCDRYGTIDLQAWLSLGQPVRLVEQKSFPAFFHRTSGSDESLGGRSKEGVCSTDLEVRLEACLDKRRRSERKGAPWDFLGFGRSFPVSQKQGQIKIGAGEHRYRDQQRLTTLGALLPPRARVHLMLENRDQTISRL
ncbi:hypothetical protein SCHPADRAFT_220498 [Schizopora paradoxa]|uniref:Uncharacterized protein n=1 Tax=Schizopora paradoxa TaxID=27342 RepID=A0A0H2RWL2_9AGAM|nr:hypothetical protein SCHPADRAFT_220498 [Schizopora paradoxa]